MSKEEVWRQESNSVEEAKTSNKSTSFECSVCEILDNAPTDTKRAKLELCKECFGKKKDHRQNKLNDLTGSEWALLSKSVEQYNGKRTAKQKMHGAAFPASLVESQIKIYTKKGDLVLDPFLGVGTTTEVAELLGRKSIGIELNPEFATLALKDIKDRENNKVICDDVRNLKKHIPNDSINFIITSPPYATLLKTVKGAFAYKWREHSELNVIANPQPYSKHEADLGNLSYSDFMDNLVQIFKDTFEVLKSNSYAVWIVKDYRDLKNEVPMVSFHSDVIQAATEGGFTLWDIRVYDQTKFRPLVVLGYPSRNYYLNIGHSYILVFKKTSGKKH